MLLAFLLAGSVTHTVQTPYLATPFQTTVVVPRFNQNLGTLTAATVHVHLQAIGAIGIENIDPVLTLDGPAAAWVLGTLYTNGMDRIFSSGNIPCGTVHLPPFDGTVDFSGPSGTTMLIPNSATDHGPWSAYVYDDWIGNGPVFIQLSGSSNGAVIGNHDYQNSAAAISVQMTVSVRYDYDTTPQVFCTTLWVNCPCGQLPSQTHGCIHSANVNGAALGWSGASSLSADTFQLTAFDLPPSAIGLFFEGTASTISGTPFGDGVRCVGGTLRRLGIKQASAGVATYPGSNNPPIGTAPGYRAYQFWYRDPAGLCMFETFNLTSAVATVWTP